MNTDLLSLLHLSDPTLPIGGFNHSAGLETFVSENVITDADDLSAYLHTQLTQNWVYNDGAYVSLAHDATSDMLSGSLKSFNRIIETDRLAVASKSARESREASIKLGLRLLKVFSLAQQNTTVGAIQEAIKLEQMSGTYPVIFGVLSACEKISKKNALTAFYYNTCMANITNGVKLIPLSQTDGQKILFSLRKDIMQAVKKSMTVEEKTTGASCAAAEIRSMRHERLYTRLYMS